MSTPPPGLSKVRTEFQLLRLVEYWIVYLTPLLLIKENWNWPSPSHVGLVRTREVVVITVKVLVALR